MDLAYEAGTILLENGAEISRVEETMSRIATHYNVDDNSFYVLSNGITATGKGYARTKFIPIHGASLDKVVEVNQLSRDVVNDKCSIGELEQRLKEIRNMKQKPAMEQIIASAFGSAAFCIIFGGDFLDAAASFVAGFLLWIFVIFIGAKYLSRITNNIAASLFATLLCLVMQQVGFGHHLSNMIIGAIIPLIPGIAFTNGIRDLASSDYLAGVTRLLDALLVFLCIALGVAIAFMIDQHIHGEMIVMGPLTADPITANFFIQTLAALIGTIAFAVLFGVPRRFYFDCGICGMLGWVLFIILRKHTEMSMVEMVFLATAVVALSASVCSVLRKCPITVFIISGIFPLVPGEGIFRTSYNIVSDQLFAAMHTGMSALKAAIAIAFAIIIFTEFKNKLVRI